MIGGLILVFCLGTTSVISYGIGKLHGYDQWDKENEGFQNGLWEEVTRNGL